MANMATETDETTQKPIVLHIGDPIKYNEAIYARFSELYTVIRPSAEERQRPEFIKALKEGRWGNFSAIFRPYWSTGGEMGKWDTELVSFLPSSVRIFASAGAGYDWADVGVLANHGHGMSLCVARSPEFFAQRVLNAHIDTLKALSTATRLPLAQSPLRTSLSLASSPPSVSSHGARQQPVNPPPSLNVILTPPL